ncbi:unnamed protein product, partial [Discosporangium mesarthrocarpum]
MGAGLMETTTTVTKRAHLQGVGAIADQRGRSSSSEVLQVELSVKHAFGIPVARDSRVKDIRQRGLRVCLFYQPPREVDRDAGAPRPKFQDHFLGNCYKTLAVQHPQKEEQWLFPDSSEGERKFVVRTDFGPGIADDRTGGRGRVRGGGEEDNAAELRSRERLFLLVELTCTVQTERNGAGGAGRGDWREGEDQIKGPLKNFLARRRSKARGSDTDGSSSRGDNTQNEDSASSGESCAEHSDGSGSYSDHSVGRGSSRRDGRGRAKSLDSATVRGRSSRGTQGRSREREDITGKGKGRRRGVSEGGDGQHRKHWGQGRSIKSRRSQGRRLKGSRGSDGDTSSDSSEGRPPEGSGLTGSSTGRRKRGKRQSHVKGVGRKGPLWSRQRIKRRAEGKKSKGRKQVTGGGHPDVAEVEMSCGWALIPFLDLVTVQEVTRVRYQLSGGTPFAKSDINQDEVMTRRYGWRAVLKAMKMEGISKDSEIEIKILPIKTLPKGKQEDIFRLPRNIVLSDTFVSLVRSFREYAANSLAKRTSPQGMGSAGFGVSSASSEPILALFPRLAADPPMMMALKSQWEAEARRIGVRGGGIRGGGGGVGGGWSGGGLGSTLTATLTGGQGNGKEREIEGLLKAFESAVLRMWPAFCHIDSQK